MTNNIAVAVISDSHEFALLRDEWNELLEISNQNTIFLRWEWLYNWWEVYGTGSGQLCIYVARENGRLLGIAPLCIQKKYRYFKELSFLGTNVICSDHLDFILYQNREKEVLHEILLAISSNNNWDTLELRNISSTSTIISAIESFFGRNKVFIDRKYTTCPYIPLTSPWETVYSAYSPLIRNVIKRKSKKLEKLHKISYCETTSDSDVRNVFAHFIELNKLRFEQKKMRSPFCDADFCRFHENVVADLSPKGMVRFGFVKADDNFIAGIYLLTYNNSHSYYQSGFDPAWDNYSPGTLLFHNSIKTAYEQGAKEFDFLQGDEKYKSNWTEFIRYNTKLCVYKNDFRGDCLYRIIELRSYFIKLLRSI